MDSLSLTEAVRCHAGGENALPLPERTASLREILRERLTDQRDPRWVRHPLTSLVSVLVARSRAVTPGHWRSRRQRADGTRRSWRRTAAAAARRPACSSRRRPQVTAAAVDGKTTRDNALWLRKAKNAHYLFQVLGNQPGAFALLDALPWPAAPVAAATIDTAPQVISALTNLVITLFRLQGVTGYTEETRRNAQNPRRAIHLLARSPG
jgi:hypothetical protein